MSASCLPLLLGGAAPRTSMPDVIEAGRTAATLSDWQTITYFLIFLLVVSTVERLISGYQYRTTARLLASSMDKLGEATQSRATDIKVTLALIQQDLGDIKHRLPSKSEPRT